MELRRHIGTDPLAEQAFDLIHARLVLMHVPQRQQALARLVAALKPRGWLVIEEFDGRIIDKAIPTAGAADAERFRKMGRAFGVYWTTEVSTQTGRAGSTATSRRPA